MLIGLDVGGTFTDAVVLDKGKVLKSSKHRTTKYNLMEGILATLDEVLPIVPKNQIERVTLSTTVVTNSIVEHKEKPVDLYIIPGPGLNITAELPRKPIILKGYTDHQGKITAPWREDELVQYQNFSSKSKYAAVSAKFSVRNPKEEQRLAEQLKNDYSFISEGAKLSGNLNFVRRTVSAYYNSAVLDSFLNFQHFVKEALASRDIKAPFYILKADGGSLPISVIEDMPVETAFTGPAASILGMKALGHIPNDMTVALDIGGTTTDISLWRNGEPLMARGGIHIGDYPSSVRSFEIKSIGIGGESVVALTENHKIQVGPERVGASVALGGTTPTLGDALITAGKVSFGDVAKAKAAIQQVAEKVGLTLLETVEAIIQKAIETIQEGINQTIINANRIPIYTVKDIVKPNYFTMEHLLIVGGTAESLGPLLGEMLEVPVEIPPAAAVANAIGAAVASETVMLTLHVDTMKRVLVIPELGVQEKTSLQTLAEVKKNALQRIEAEGERIGLEGVKGEVIMEEDFQVIQGWQSSGHIITVQVQLKAEVMNHVTV